MCDNPSQGSFPQGRCCPRDFSLARWSAVSFLGIAKRPGIPRRPTRLFLLKSPHKADLKVLQNGQDIGEESTLWAILVCVPYMRVVRKLSSLIFNISFNSFPSHFLGFFVLMLTNMNNILEDLLEQASFLFCSLGFLWVGDSSSNSFKRGGR